MFFKERMTFIKLICLPYAGGAASAYYGWKKYLDDDIDLIPVELAGRGRRSGEVFYDNLYEAVDDVLTKIQERIEADKYIIFGHCLGSVILYELIYKIISKELRLPEHIIFSGRMPPHVRTNKQMHNQPISILCEEVMNLGGTSRETFDNPEMLEYFEPIIRADYRMLENHNYAIYEKKIDCYVSVFMSSRDPSIDNRLMKKWVDVASQSVNFYVFEGSHFYFIENLQVVVNTINEIHNYLKYTNF